MEEHMLPCLFKQTFGFDCMGCGLQRAIYLLFQGEFKAAFFMYPAIYSLLLLVGYTLAFFLKPQPKQGRKVIFMALCNALIIMGAYVFKMRALLF